MKSVISVVGAAFVERGKVFAARRSYGSEYVIHKYEFVGGKVEQGESEETAIKRECLEELDLDVQVCRKFAEEQFEYPDKIVNLKIYLCRMLSGYNVKEHEECRWLPPGELDSVEWLPADLIAVDELRKNPSVFQ